MSDTYISGDMTKTADFKLFTGILKAAGSDEDEGVLRIKGIASSTVRDRHGDRMERSALKDMEAAANDNLTIFVNHSYNVPEDVVGSAEKAVLKRRSGETDEDGNPLYDLELSVLLDAGNPRAVKTYEAIQKGVKLGMSIGAMIPKGGAKYDEENHSFIIHHVDLLETSVVSIPANPRSWVGGAVKSLRDNPDKLENPEIYRKALAEAANVDPAYLEKDAEPEAVVEETEPEVQESVCESCGGGKRKPKDGCDADYHKDLEPDVEAGTEPADGETSSQEAAADPEIEEGAEPEHIEESADPDPEGDIDLTALASATEGVLAITQALSVQLDTAVEALEAEKQLRIAAETQRDETVMTATELVAKVAGIVELIAKTPSGRKTSQFVEAQKSFEHLEGIYSEKFLTILNQHKESE